MAKGAAGSGGQGQRGWLREQSGREAKVRGEGAAEGATGSGGKGQRGWLREQPGREAKVRGDG
eukprot:1188500-Prorocentrum_minimum.AAC.2